MSVIATPEQVSNALYQHLLAIPEMITVSRTPRFFSDVSDAEKPAIFIREGDDDVQQQTNVTLPKETLHYVLELQAYANNPDDIPAKIQNDLIKIIRDSFISDNPRNPHINLGGLCKWAKINGIITKDGGILGQQTVAFIPVEILLTQ